MMASCTWVNPLVMTIAADLLTQHQDSYKQLTAGVANIQ